MDRREFLKSVLTVAALAPVVRISAKAGADGEKSSDIIQGAGITRRKYKNTAMTIPLLGFGCMRLPSGISGIDKAETAKMVERYMRAGGNYFDTAYFYLGGQSEICIGDVLQKYPRDSYYLTDKMPLSHLRKAEDVERIFKEQLKKCKTDYFDFYMFHAVNHNNFKKAEKFHVWEFLSKMKEQGKIRKLGFSFHDTPEVLKKIVAAHPWDFGQIQLNYLDWELYKSKEQYEILTAAGIPVIVMEPLRGGQLANLSPEAEKVLKNVKPDASCASWAFRYAATLPNVLCILSGMSKMEHLEENIRTFSPFVPLSGQEQKTLDTALKTYRKLQFIPCTDCKYCQPCPVGVEIPRIFGLYNQYKNDGNKRRFLSHYKMIPAESQASACVNCQRCVKQCPQKIQIPAELKKIAAFAK